MGSKIFQWVVARFAAPMRACKNQDNGGDSPALLSPVDFLAYLFMRQTSESNE